MIKVESTYNLRVKTQLSFTISCIFFKLTITDEFVFTKTKSGHFFVQRLTEG